jgi:molecular chaperone DnaK
VRLLHERLGQEPHKEVNPDLCVAMGAAIQAGIIAGTDVGAVLVDITPHSLGIKCLSSDPMGMPFPHRFAAIVHRGTSLPASQSDVFFTSVDNQTQVEIDIYQGEDSDVRRNHRIGRFLVEGLSRVPQGNPIVVQLDLNLDGVLRVSAKERATGLSKTVTIENALAKFRREEHAAALERLERLWQDEGEDEYEDEDFDEAGEGPDDLPAVGPEGMPELVPGPREGQREAVQARALLEKAQRLLDRAAPEDRPELERLMQAVQTALTDRKWTELTTASNTLADTLFYLEDV